MTEFPLIPGEVGVEWERFLIENEPDYVHIECGNSGTIVQDVAPNCLELITEPKKTVFEIREAMQKMTTIASCRGYHFHDGASQIGGSWRKNPRYDALIAAATIENPTYWKRIHMFPNVAATHCTFGVDPSTDTGASVLSFLSHIGPYFFNAVCRREEIPTLKTHMSNYRFARMERAPMYDRWYTSAKDVREQFESIPAFITEDNQPDGANLQQWGNPLHHGTFWDLARPKPHVGDGCIEFRGLPSMPAHNVGDYVRELLSIVNDWIDVTNGKCFESLLDSSNAFQQLFDLHRHSIPLIPRKPLSRQEWNHEFHRNDFPSSTSVPVPAVS